MSIGRRWAVAAAIAAIVGLSGAALAADPNSEMRRALRALHTAERHLGRAPHDYDGHRPKALELVKAAEAEVETALPPRPTRSPRPRRGAATGPAPAGTAPTPQQ